MYVKLKYIKENQEANKMKKTTLILLIMCVLLAAPLSGMFGITLPDKDIGSSFRLSAEAATVLRSGKCGSNLTWKLTDDGTLTISGTGAMDNYEDDTDQPWAEYYDGEWEPIIKKVVIANGVTSIGDNAFSWCFDLSGVVIPNSVTSIGEHAFTGCEALPDLTIPASVTFIGEYAFSWCQNLTNVTIAADIDELPWGVLSHCTSLKNLVIPEGITAIGPFAFDCCTALKSVTIPASVTYIDLGVFEGCDSLTDVYYSGSQTKWNSIEINDYEDLNAPLFAATIHFTSSSKETISANNVTLSKTTFTYNGSVQKPTVTVKNAAGKVMTKDTSYTVTYSSGCKAAGTYKVTVTGIGNYTGTVTKTFTITAGTTKETISAANVTLSSASVVYNGNVRTPTVTVKNAAGKTMTKDSSYTVTYPSGRKAAGTYYITVTGIGKYTGTVKKAFTIKKQSLDSSRVTLSKTSFTYNGSVQKPTVTVKNAAGNVMTKDSSYTVAYSSGCKAAGTYNVTVTGIGNYTGTVTKTFKIASATTKETISAANVKLSSTSVVYNGKVRTPTVTVKNAAGKTMTKDTSYTVTYSSGRKYAGTYTVTVKGIGKYTGTVVKTFKITPQPIKAENVILSATKFTYNGTVQQPAVTVKNAAGTVMTVDKSYKIEYSAGCKAAGTYTVTITGFGDYSGTIQKTFTIARQPLVSSRVTLSKTSFTYTGSVQKPTITVKNAEGKTLTKDSSYTVAYSTGCKAKGTYTVTVTGTGNYTGSVTKSFTIK